MNDQERRPLGGCGKHMFVCDSDLCSNPPVLWVHKREGACEHAQHFGTCGYAFICPTCAATKNARIAELEDLVYQHKPDPEGHAPSMTYKESCHWHQEILDEIRVVFERWGVDMSATPLMFFPEAAHNVCVGIVRRGVQLWNECERLAARSGEPLPGGDDVHRNISHATAGRGFETVEYPKVERDGVDLNDWPIGGEPMGFPDINDGEPYEPQETDDAE